MADGESPIGVAINTAGRHCLMRASTRHTRAERHAGRHSGTAWQVDLNSSVRALSLFVAEHGPLLPPVATGEAVHIGSWGALAGERLVPCGARAILCVASVPHEAVTAPCKELLQARGEFPAQAVQVAVTIEPQYDLLSAARPLLLRLVPWERGGPLAP